MLDFNSVLLNVWREACRHIDISQSTATIATLLAEHFPIGQLLVRRIDRERSCLETVAVGLPDAAGGLSAARTPCSAAQLQCLAAWCGQTRLSAIAAAPGDPLAPILAATLGGEILAGPLLLSHGGHGVLVLAPTAGRSFAPHDVELLQVLLEPFSVALDNDQRVNDMAALREAAEADKRSLLNRLGRSKLGDTIVGMDSGLRAVMERVELVARSDVPVLIFGETGSGKELVARAIHNRSPRHSGPFIRVNCGAIPHELIDSQLFGHERGAFTGAVEARKGWFERADGGTLLLDEIGELPLAAQVRLLRILQDGWLDRVGGQSPIKVDVRMVAATHRDLAAMVSEGAFREDLWYRIAVFPILLPPLRERRDDIPALVRHFADRAATRFGLCAAIPAADELEMLMNYPWPGNIRELASVIDRAAILGEGRRLEVAKALGTATGPTAVSPSAGLSRSKATAADVAGGILPLDTVVRQHIEAALTATSGRVEGRTGAAQLLQINPHTLRARMRKLGIDWTVFREK